MKRILFFLSYFIITNAFAQIPNEKLLGTWQLVAYKTPDGRDVSLENSKFKRLKIISWNNFTVLDYNPAGNIIMTTIRGSYELMPSKGIGNYNDLVPDSSVIAENISSVSRESAGILGGKPFYGLRLDSADLLHYTGVYQTKGSETWMRVVDYRPDKLLKALISKKPGDRQYQIDPRMIIVLYGEGSQSMELKANAKFTQPLNIIKEDDVRMVEFVGYGEGIEQYGMRAHHGVFNLTVSSEVYDRTVEILRKQKNLR